MRRMCYAIVAFILVLGLTACGGQTSTGQTAETATWQEQYDLGIRYLSEGNYEEAIIAFTAAIEIDPKLPEAYIGLADVYTAQGNTNKAMEILNQALETLGENEAISAALEALNPTDPQPLEGYPKTERFDSGDKYAVLEYDEFGNKVLETWYTVADDVKTHYYEYVYEGFADEANQYGWRIVKEISYRADGTARRQWEFVYTPDSVNVTFKSCRYTSDGVDTEQFPYTMQTAGNFLEHRGDGSVDGKTYTLIMERDIDWNVFQEVWVATDGTILSQDEFDALLDQHR